MPSDWSLMRTVAEILYEGGGGFLCVERLFIHRPFHLKQVSVTKPCLLVKVHVRLLSNGKSLSRGLGLLKVESCPQSVSDTASASPRIEDTN